MASETTLVQEIQELDKNFLWHPYTQEATASLNIPIVKAKGACLYTENGSEYVDAISSWWVNIHGHGHPYLQEKLSEQFGALEHTLFAGFTHKPAVSLAKLLVEKLRNGQERVFYSDNGSTAVEVAIKMAFQFWFNKGKKKNKVLALEGAFHGDTFGAMSVSQRGAFTASFEPFLFDTIYLNIHQEEEKVLEDLQKIIDKEEENIASFIFEPLVQGAAGMKMYAPSLLDKLIQKCKESQILTIADEVMTGFGRTGKLFAIHHLRETPDIVCLSKGITGGCMPFSATTCTSEIYTAFLSMDKGKTFFHGHSYTANPLACALSLASLELFEKEDTLERIKKINQQLLSFVDEIKGSEHVRNPRVQGAILAFEVITGGSEDYFDKNRDAFYQHFLESGVLLRPLGNTIYIMPPYCISSDQLEKVFGSIRSLLKLL